MCGNIDLQRLQRDVRIHKTEMYYDKVECVRLDSRYTEPICCIIQICNHELFKCSAICTKTCRTNSKNKYKQTNVHSVAVIIFTIALQPFAQLPKIYNVSRKIYGDRANAQQFKINNARQRQTSKQIEIDAKKKTLENDVRKL